MAENSKIEWTDHTFNPWMGCAKVSPACKNCYAERDMDHRYHKVQWGPNGTRAMTSDANWNKPIYWNQNAVLRGDRTRVFCASLADVFEDWQGPILDHHGERRWIVSECGKETWISGEETEQNQLSKQVGVRAATMDDVRRKLFELIDATPNLDWLLLTKRPENIRRMWRMKRVPHPMPNHRGPSDLMQSKFRENVWLGTSVENQEYAEQRVPELLKCRDLSPVSFLSCEPLVGPVDLRNLVLANGTEHKGDDAIDGDILDALSGDVCSPVTGCVINEDVGIIDWVITGGESGPDARPCDPQWFRSLRDQCEMHNVPFHFKQWGEWAPYDDRIRDQCGRSDFHAFDEECSVFRVGKKAAGRLLDGEEHDGVPLLAAGF